MMIEVLGSSGVYAVIGIIVVAVASLFGLVVFASKEDKFEDVVAAQKREQEALIQSFSVTSSKPSKSKKKWAKIKSQRSAKSTDKDNLPVQPEADAIQESTTANIPEISLPTVEVPVKKASQKQKSKDKKKGKDVVDSKKVIAEPLAVEEEVIVVEATSQFEEEPEIKEASESTHSKDMKDEKEISAEVIVEKKETPAMNKPIIASKEETTVAQKKNKSKKAKPATPASDDHAATEKLAKDLEKAQLDMTAVQELTDILLNKQNELQQWQKPNQKLDPMEELKKKVQGLEGTLTEEKRTSLAAAHNNKELRQEIQNEKAQLQRIQLQATQKITKQGNEIQALQKRMETTQESHLHEMQNAQNQLQQLKEVLSNSGPVDTQRINEESAMLKTASMRNQQLVEEKNTLIGECSKLQQASKNVMNHYEEQKHAHENEIQKLRMAKSESETVLSNRLTEVNDKLMQHGVENKNLAYQLQMMQNELQSTKLVKEDLLTKSADSSSLQQQLSDALLEVEKLTASFKTSEDTLKKYQEVEKQNSELLKKLAQEKLELQDKLLAASDEMVIIEKLPANGLASEDQMSSEEHVHLITEKDKVISDLKEDIKSTKEELEKLAHVMHHEKHEFEDKMKHLQEDVDERKVEKKKLEEIVENLKAKNNDLREKNWKAMDALSTTEANSKKKVKETEDAVFRTLKKLSPSIKLERNKPFDEMLKEYQVAHTQAESNSSSEELDDLKKEMGGLLESKKGINEELLGLKSKNSDLEHQLKDAAKNSESSVENLKEISEEQKKANAQIEHYKNVLEETEGMLKKLQTGIETQVSSYEKKLNDKDLELKQINEKVIELQETVKNNDDKTQLESDLKKIQDDLDAEKKAKTEMESELEEAKKKMITLEENLENAQSGDDSMAQSQESLNLSAGSSSPKKKKGFKHAFSKAFHKKGEGSEVLDAASSKDEEIKKVIASKEALQKELTKLQEKIKIVENAGKDGGKSDKEKDKTIAKLTVENAELLEDLSDERDRVVVDVESPDSEHLKSELSLMKDQYEHEKETSQKLHSSIHELEEKLENHDKALQGKDTELSQMEQKLKEAADQVVVYEQKFKSDHSPTSPQRSVGAPLSEQLHQVKTELSEKEEQLESEKKATSQLRAQLASLTGGPVTHGTSV